MYCDVCVALLSATMVYNILLLVGCCCGLISSALLIYGLIKVNIYLLVGVLSSSRKLFLLLLDRFLNDESREMKNASSWRWNSFRNLKFRGTNCGCMLLYLFLSKISRQVPVRGSKKWNIDVDQPPAPVWCCPRISLNVFFCLTDLFIYFI